MAPTDMDYISKEELFSVLESMKITLPRTSKMSVEALSKRLKEGFNASQRTEDLINDDFLDPRQLKAWGDMEGLMRQTMVMQQSLSGNIDRQMNEGLPKGPEQTLEELQDIALFLGYQLSNGMQNIALSDKDVDDWAIAVRIFGTYAADENTPVFMLSYRVVRSIPNKTLQQQLAEVFPTSYRAQAMSELGRRSFLRLLNLNAKRVVPQYEPDGSENKKFAKKKWKMSFILPLGPVPMEDVGKLTTDPGCDVCGSTNNVSRCTECLTSVYCSPGCQKKDWPTHRNICRTLKGGSWTEINLGENPSAPMDGLPSGMFVSRMNMHESWQGSRRNNMSRIGGENGDAPDIPKDIHGTKAFLVKFQVGLGGGRPNHMMMYDRQRSFTVFWKRDGDPDAFSVGERAIGSDLKMYRWAMRTGPKTMKVCFDQPPKDTPPW